MDPAVDALLQRLSQYGQSEDDQRRFPRECFLTKFTVGTDTAAVARAMQARGCKWATWEGVDFGAGGALVQIEAAAPVGAGVEVRSDGPQGALLASGCLPATQGAARTAVTTLRAVLPTGLHGVTLVFSDAPVEVASVSFPGLRRE